ncbi:hypothetical protein AtNW77_Chr1g0055431 [Arabidopsis thaliana]
MARRQFGLRKIYIDLFKHNNFLSLKTPKSQKTWLFDSIDPNLSVYTNQFT